jgi:hypothetical protein
MALLRFQIPFLRFRLRDVAPSPGVADLYPMKKLPSIIFSLIAIASHAQSPDTVTIQWDEAQMISKTTLTPAGRRQPAIAPRVG